MYKHEIEDEIQAGKKFRRAGWLKDHYLQKNPFSDGLEIDAIEAKDLGISPDTKVSVSDDVFVLVQGANKATVGYTFSHEDLHSQDWEVK